MNLSAQKAFIKQVGFRTWFLIKLWPLMAKRFGSTRLNCVSLPGSEFPLYFRPNASDPGVFQQIFIQREYASFDDLDALGLVLDCGANVGFSSAYFLTRFPSCSLIAVEPEPGNFDVLKRNLAAFGERARAINAAIWSWPAALKILKAEYRDGLDWSTQVAECAADEKPDVQAVDIGTLLRDSGHERISLLKMDIEGAEAVVFSTNFESWIDRVDNIAIELHDDSSFGKGSVVFEQAISGRGFDVSVAGELTLCRRPKA